MTLQKLARNMMESEEILENYRGDAINQLDRFKDLMATTSEPMPDSELFVLSSAAQMFAVAVQGYFKWRNIAGLQHLDAPMIAPEV